MCDLQEMTINEMYQRDKSERGALIKTSDTTKKSSTSEFTIEHILNRAGTTKPTNVNDSVDSSHNGNSSCNTNCLNRGNCLNCVNCLNGSNCFNNDHLSVTYPWLHCTRYTPPKIARNYRKDVPQRRQLGKHPRIPFTSHQLTMLEDKFQNGHYLSTEEVADLSKKLQLPDVRVKIWFQNRRARERRERHNDNVTERLTDGSVVNESPISTATTTNNTIAMTTFNNKTLTMLSNGFATKRSTNYGNLKNFGTQLNVNIANGTSQANPFD